MWSNPFDKRIMDRYVDKGIITKDAAAQHMKKLPDETPNAVWVELDLEEAEVAPVDGRGGREDE